MSNMKAFTLVELLVVMAIISLLIGIIAPSLNAAKDLARATYCQSTLNALNKSALVYAESNRGYLMVYEHKIVNNCVTAPDNTYKSYVCFKRSAPDPATALFSDARGLGLVYAQGILDKPELFYCPSQQDRRSQLNFYPKPWGTAIPPESDSDFIRNSYMWNPWVEPIPDDPAGRFTYEDRLVLERHKNDRFLTSDLLDRKMTMSHIEGNKAKWNMGYVDGHVAAFEGKTLYNLFTVTGLDTANDWNMFNQGVRPELPGSR